MTEGTVPVPLPPCADRDDNVLPVHERLHFGGAQSGGSETAVSVELIIKHFSRPGKRLPFFLIEFQKERYLPSCVG
jgi:hypothetical protein